jgi:hypothetical protein
MKNKQSSKKVVYVSDIYRLTRNSKARVESKKSDKPVKFISDIVNGSGRYPSIQKMN